MISIVLEKSTEIKPERTEGRILLAGAYFYNQQLRKSEEIYDYLLTVDTVAAARLMGLLQSEINSDR